MLARTKTTTNALEPGKLQSSVALVAQQQAGAAGYIKRKEDLSAGLGSSIAQSSSSSWRTLLNLPKRPRDFGWVETRMKYNHQDLFERIAEQEKEEEEKDVVVGTYRFEPSQSKRGLTK